MRNAHEIQARIDSAVVEIDQLNHRIDQLSCVVKEGGDGWMAVLEDLANAYRKRNEIRIQMQNLYWVITPGAELSI